MLLASLIHCSFLQFSTSKLTFGIFLKIMFATDCPNSGEIVQNGACICANTFETVQNGACTCPAGQIVQNGACSGKTTV